MENCCHKQQGIKIEYKEMHSNHILSISILFQNNTYTKLNSKNGYNSIYKFQISKELKVDDHRNKREYLTW